MSKHCLDPDVSQSPRHPPLHFFFLCNTRHRYNKNNKRHWLMEEAKACILDRLDTVSLCPLRMLCPWACPFTPLNLRLPICKMGRKQLTTKGLFWGLKKSKITNDCKQWRAAWMHEMAIIITPIRTADVLREVTNLALLFFFSSSRKANSLFEIYLLHARIEFGHSTMN